jgi:multiple sugar transport system permease protein
VFEINRQSRNQHWRNTKNLLGYLFMMPTILVLGTFVVLPILYVVFLSLHKVQLLGSIKYKFIGLRNFTRLVEDEQLGIALKNTAEYVAIVVPSQTILALILAVTLNSSIRGRNWWRIRPLAELILCYSRRCLCYSQKLELHTYV